MKRAFPSVLLAAVLLTGTLALLLFMILSRNASSEEKQKVQIGLVGDLTDPYLELGMHTLEKLDSTRFTVEFYPLSEEEAQKRLKLGQLTAYARIPEGLIESVMYGENKKVTYVTSSGSEEMITLLVRELMDVVSDLLIESQNATYGMQRVMRAQGVSEEQYWEATNEINLRYFDMLLGRSELYELEIIGVSNQLSLPGYYVCSMLLFFLLLWGIACSPLFVKKDYALQKLLLIRGQKVWGQILGEYVGYVTLLLLSLFAVGGLLLFCAYQSGFIIPEWEHAGGGELFGFLFRSIPAALLTAALELFLFELVSGVISGVLLQFLSAVCLGYLSGCFYPVSFLPDGMRHLAAMLPSGAALKYLTGSMRGETSFLNGAGLLGYGLLFLGAAVMVRKRKVGIC